MSQVIILFSMLFILYPVNGLTWAFVRLLFIRTPLSLLEVVLLGKGCVTSQKKTAAKETKRDPDKELSHDCPSGIMGSQIKFLTSPLRIMNISCPMSPLRTMYSLERTCAGFTLVHNRRMKGRFASLNSGTF